MAATIRFRALLPFAHALIGGIFGTLGAWQRVSALNRPIWDGETLWHTTARFHFWPWPYKFALSINWPAFLGAALLSSALGNSPQIDDYAAMALSALFAIPIWYWIGSRFDDSIRSGCIGLRSLIGIWLLFILACLVGALTLPGAFGLSFVAWIFGVVVLSKCRAGKTNPSRP
jgi:hypothetical protein